jgi:acylphosphatase
MLRLHLIAHGNVQGVGFRAFSIRIGASIGLVGYAKNLPDGTVEIVAEGTQENLDEFCRRIKVKLPAGISVDNLEKVEIKEIKKPSFASFGVAY